MKEYDGDAFADALGAAVEKAFRRADVQAFSDPARAYRRPGGGNMQLTPEWWDLYDRAVASRQRKIRHWGDPAELLGGRAPGGFGAVGVARGRFFG